MEPKTPRDVIRDFYDEYGWKKDAQTGRSLDDIAHEDQDARVQRYMADNENRYKFVFAEGGRYFLDAACGGEPRRHLAPGFHRHVCVDLSRVGLAEARDRLGENGFYVLADLSRLPFLEGTFDGALASHCLYHVAAEQQPVVVQEMVRTTRPGRSVLIFYSHKRNLNTAIEKIAVELGKAWKRLFRVRADSGPVAPPLYYHRVPLEILVKGVPGVEITCLRTLTKMGTTLLGKLRLLRISLPILKSLERAFPRMMVHVGTYVAIRIRIPEDGN